MKRFIISCISAFIVCVGVMILTVKLGLPEAVSSIIYEGTTIATFAMASINAYRMVANDKCTESKTNFERR